MQPSKGHFDRFSCTRYTCLLWKSINLGHEGRRGMRAYFKSHRRGKVSAHDAHGNDVVSDSHVKHSGVVLFEKLVSLSCTMDVVDKLPLFDGPTSAEAPRYG
jgi:hypothetical protein